MANNQSLVGNIDLSALNGARLETTAGGNQTVVIPVSGNPSIFVGSKDIEVREVPDNRYGNTHFVKLSVGRKKREEMGLTQDSVKQYTPIIGNLKPLAKRSREEDMPEG